VSAGDERNAGAERFEHEARRLLRRHAEELDGATASRLNRARQAALAEFDRRRGPAWRRGWRPALVTAAVAALALALWSGREPALAPASAPLPSASGPGAATDLELMLADENLEMIEELEFYDWVESEAGGGDTGAGQSG
jgi:hypothetical protein